MNIMTIPLMERMKRNLYSVIVKQVGKESPPAHVHARTF